MISILVLDDDPFQKKFIELYLKKFKFEADVYQACGFEEADKLLQDTSIDVMIVDHRINMEKGIDYIKSHSLKIPFIYSSFYLTEDLIKQVISLGGTPLDKNDILSDPTRLENAINICKVA
jgi:response regulator of citrate/malate metabolism